MPRAILLVVVVSLLAKSTQTLQEPRPDLLTVPDGFTISVWAQNIPYARSLASVQVTNGSTLVYVGSSSKTGTVHYLVDRDSDGTADEQGVLLRDIDTPNGVAIMGDDLFVSGFSGGKGMLWRLHDAHSFALNNTPFEGPLTIVTDKLPGDTWHGRRFLRFDPNGLLVLGVGAPCNECELGTTRTGVQFGALYALNVTSGALIQLATGVRNSVGFDFHPASRRLYFTDNGRDAMGADFPDCELNALPFTADYYQAGALGGRNTANTTAPALVLLNGSLSSFGFPFCHAQGEGDPYRRELGGGVPLPDPQLNPNNSVINCSAPGSFIQPVQALGPHTAPLGMRFYRLNSSAPGAFPANFNNTIFIVQRGSWNRPMKIGYRVMMLQLEEAAGSGAGAKAAAGSKPREYKQFASGWLQNEDKPGNYSWGRPVDVEQLPDGSLLVSDDENGWLYRISYHGSSQKSSKPGGSSDDKAGAASSSSSAGARAGRYHGFGWLLLLLLLLL